MAIEKVPKEYSSAAYERIISTLVRRIEVLEGAQMVRKIGSLASGAAPLLAIGELGFVRNDNQNLDLVLRADDGRNYRIGALATTGTSTTGTGGTIDHGALSGLTDDDHNQYVLNTGDTVTGAVVIDGSADAIQLRIQGNATQTNSLLVLEDSAGNDQVTVSNDGATVINEEGNDADFRVESDTDVNALYVDASANTVQVGAATASDSAKFYVSGKISASGAVEVNGDLLHDGTNIRFHAGTGAAQSTGWSVTNVTPDKSFDANSTSIDEIADVLGTLITHLLTRGDLGA